MDILQAFTYAAFGGIIPCLFWLIFWLRESHEHPEPPKIILACFIGGMISTILVFPFQMLVHVIVNNDNSLLTLALWAYIEEIAKLFVCWFIILRTHKEHVPIDIVIYMVTVALGFAALENVLFLITPLTNGQALDTIMTGGFRFVGANLLHTLASAIVGVFLAFAFFKNRVFKEEYAFYGILCAGFLHTLFNFFILEGSGAQTFLVFASIWLLVIMLIVLLEKVKTITNKNS